MSFGRMIIDMMGDETDEEWSKQRVLMLDHPDYYNHCLRGICGSDSYTDRDNNDKNEDPKGVKP